MSRTFRTIHHVFRIHGVFNPGPRNCLQHGYDKSGSKLARRKEREEYLGHLRRLERVIAEGDMADQLHDQGDAL